MAIIKKKQKVADALRASSLLPEDNSTVLRYPTFQEGFSQSEMGVWDDCAEKWYLGYNHKLRKKGTYQMYFIYGTAVHKTLESWYRHGELEIASLQEVLLEENPDVILTGEQQSELDMWQAILEVQMKRYIIHYPDELAVWEPWSIEESIEVEFEGIKFRGKIDLGWDRDLMDHKTYGIDDSIGWNFRFQFMFYIWLAQKAMKKKIERFWVNGIKKPQLRQGKAESVESFAVRILQDHIQTPEKYFQRTPLLGIQNSMEHFEERVLRPKINRIKLLTQPNTSDILIESLVRNQNTHHCVHMGQVCEFLPICQHGFKREGAFYTQREHKHQELQPCK